MPYAPSAISLSIYPLPALTKLCPPGRTTHNMNMICVPCRKRRHEECPGGTWCDCQHLPPRETAETAEPPLSWVRQG